MALKYSITNTIEIYLKINRILDFIGLSFHVPKHIDGCLLLAPLLYIFVGDSHSEFGPIDDIKNTHLETDFFMYSKKIRTNPSMHFFPSFHILGRTRLKKTIVHEAARSLDVLDIKALEI